MNERDASHAIDLHRASVMDMQRKARAFSDEELFAEQDKAPHVYAGENSWHYVLQYELLRRIRADREAA